MIAPLFTAGGLLVVQGIAELALEQSDPFHVAFGARLALDDLIAVMAFLSLVGMAMAQRRRIAVHAGAMLATILLVAPPILGRLLPMPPGFPGAAQAGLHRFAPSFELTQLLAIGGSIALAAAYPKSAMPFGFVAAVLVLETILFETIARMTAWQTTAWQMIAFAVLAIPARLVTAIGLAIGLSVVWVAWACGMRPRALTITATS